MKKVLLATLFMIAVGAMGCGAKTDKDVTIIGDADVLEYYETWNEDDFSEMYRGGASLTIA